MQLPLAIVNALVKIRLAERRWVSIHNGGGLASLFATRRQVPVADGTKEIAARHRART